LNEVRIIGGKWKRRKLGFPNRAELRPTPDRVRETLFNWLIHDVVESRCLDLFAGSGALGFEALSRGAQHTTFVERDPTVARSLAANQVLLGATASSTLVRGQALPWLRRQQQTWDLVFLDPPYRGNQLAGALTILLENDLLASGALLAADLPARATAPAGPWRILKQTRAGDAQLVLLELDAV
jgi:16S rRNA (guanine966-N2)-methyltransferase